MAEGQSPNLSLPHPISTPPLTHDSSPHPHPTPTSSSPHLYTPTPHNTHNTHRPCVHTATRYFCAYRSHPIPFGRWVEHCRTPNGQPCVFVRVESLQLPELQPFLRFATGAPPRSVVREAGWFNH